MNNEEIISHEFRFLVDELGFVEVEKSKRPYRGPYFNFPLGWIRREFGVVAGIDLEFGGTFEVQLQRVGARGFERENWWVGILDLRRLCVQFDVELPPPEIRMVELRHEQEAGVLVPHVRGFVTPLRKVIAEMERFGVMEREVG